MLAFLTIARPAAAKEGMWIPILLNISDMQAMGLKLSAEDIYSVNKGSLKDAIVHFGGGCTSEIISEQSLLLTNHHCGFSQIANHSSVEKDYLKNGFWAMNKNQELPNPGLTATFIVRIEDVTGRVLDGTADLKGQAYQDKIAENMRTVNASATQGTHYESYVRPFFYGNQYFLFVTETFKDVRLVGAPPSSVGKYGADTDNWMWPRHTGDFSIFRIYAGADNKPADYSENNVPFKPRHHLPVSLRGVNPGDFTMVYGFPGTTQEFLVSNEVEFITQQLNPTRVSMRDKSLDVINATMMQSDALRIMYAAKQARIANAWKKWIGENNGLKRLNALEKKRALEAEFEKRANSKSEWKEKYAGIVDRIKAIVTQQNTYTMARSGLIEFGYYGPEFLRMTQAFSALVNDYETMDEAKRKETIEKLRGQAEGFYENVHLPADEQLLAVLAGPYFESLDPSLRPDVYASLQAKYKGNWKQYAADVFAKSYFTNKDRTLALLDKFSKGSVKKVKADMGYVLAMDVLDAWRVKAAGKYTELENEKNLLMGTFVAGLMEMFPDKLYWPDANSTLRVTYGKVEGFEPADGVVYHHYTTMQGVLEKYVPGDRDFDLPPRLLELARAKDYGRYTNAQGELPVAFTASNHTTGGNSGSPVIDGSGNLIGLNFDRAWESTMSDIMYDPERCRNIAVDVRYVLWVVDKYAGAGHLVDEMTLVK